MSLTSSHLSSPLPLPTIMTDTAGVAHIIVSGPEITKQWMWSTDGDYMWEKTSQCNYYLLQWVTDYYRNSEDHAILLSAILLHLQTTITHCTSPTGSTTTDVKHVGTSLPPTDHLLSTAPPCNTLEN